MDGEFEAVISQPFIVGDAFERNFVKDSKQRIFAIDIPIHPASSKAIDWIAGNN